jgi:lipoprotein-anchoring transpeptidase ErfK/SrfK
MGARRVGALALVAALGMVGCAGPGDAEGRKADRAVAAQAAADSTVPAAPTTAPAVGVVDTAGKVVARARGDVVVARSRPTVDAPVLVELANPTASGGALVFLVLTSPELVPIAEWLEVMLPVRPNGTVGWIRTSNVDLSLDPFRIDIDVSERRLDLYEGDVLTLSTEIAVGVGATPTPHGQFYLAELLQPPDPNGVYGPYAFGLSGFSEVLDRFAGGDGVIGIHGTNDPSSLGREVSHGCIRVHNDVIVDLAATVPLGTPVSIHP